MTSGLGLSRLDRQMRRKKRVIKTNKTQNNFRKLSQNRIRLVRGHIGRFKEVRRSSNFQKDPFGTYGLVIIFMTVF